MDGMVFNIQRFSIHDGPGIRTTVFLKGCNLRCKWCHNPESFSMKQELEIIRHKCTSCGLCSNICNNKANIISDSRLIYLRDKCESCFKCATVCPNNVRKIVGEMSNSDEIISTVLRDKPFYETSNGGVTFSGGEPLLQIDFLRELLVKSQKNGLHTAVETALCVPQKSIESILRYVNLFLVDLKVYNREKHKEFTGVFNDLILENIIFLSKNNADILIRVPVVTDVNDNYENIENTAKFLSNNTNIKKVELLPFHNLAEGKYENLGKDYEAKDFKIPSKEKIGELSQIFSNYNINIIYNK